MPTLTTDHKLGKHRKMFRGCPVCEAPSSAELNKSDIVTATHVADFKVASDPQPGGGGRQPVLKRTSNRVPTAAPATVDGSEEHPVRDVPERVSATDEPSLSSFTQPTREAWMLAAVDALRTDFDAVGCKVPPVRVSVGWPHGRGSAKHALGQCFGPALVADGVPNLFVTPTQHEPAEILETLGHEMLHAAGHNAHRGAFVTLAKKLGYTNGGKTKTSRAESPNLYARMDVLAAKLGPFPHSRVSGSDRVNGGGLKVQSTRMLKLVCPEDGYLVRTTAKWIEVGLPSCPDGHQMEASK